MREEPGQQTDMRRKLGLRLAIILPILLMLAVSAWIGVNKLVARQFDIIHAVELGEAELVAYICRWDLEQMKKEKTMPFAPMKLSLLHLARSGEVVNALLEAGADVNGGDNVMIPPLRWAVYHQHSGAAVALIRAGADFASAGGTAFLIHLAVSRDDGEVVKALVAAGVDITTKDQHGFTPLGKAVTTRKHNAVAALIASGASLGPITGEGETPLHLASASCPTLIPVLIEAGCDINAVNKQGNTPLDYAIDEVSHRLLLELGAKTGDELRGKITGQGMQN